jgi:hypothetical protein
MYKKNEFACIVANFVTGPPSNFPSFLTVCPLVQYLHYANFHLCNVKFRPADSCRFKFKRQVLQVYYTHCVQCTCKHRTHDEHVILK